MVALTMALRFFCAGCEARFHRCTAKVTNRVCGNGKGAGAFGGSVRVMGSILIDRWSMRSRSRCEGIKPTDDTDLSLVVDAERSVAKRAACSWKCLVLQGCCGRVC